LGTKDNEDYCGHNDGDSFCARTVGESKPYCLADTQTCIDSTGMDLEALLPSGCVAQQPAPECRNVCGREDPNCVDPTNETLTETTETETTSSTTEDPGTETDPDTDTMDTSTSTGPTGCQGPDDCPDAASPFCVGEVCVPCTGAAEPDVACAELNAAAPLCVEDACVQCTDDNDDACGDITPLCDTEAMTCVACEFHEQCQDLDLPACNVATGACFNADDVSNVAVNTDGSIQAAINLVADGTAHAIVLTGATPGDHSITIDGGKTIAIVSTNNDLKSIDGEEGSPTITVTGEGTTAYLHRLQLTANTDDVGVSVESSATLYADSTQVVQNSGGGVQLASGTTGFIRNSMIGANGGQFDPTTGIENAGDLSILYSSVVANDGDAEDSLQCSGGATTIRNSIVIGAGNNSVNCTGLTATQSSFDEAVPGRGNENVGSLTPGWFDGVGAGDLHLTPSGQTEFNGVAIWQLGDPPFDFDGDLRPAEDGASDYAGADVP